MILKIRLSRDLKCEGEKVESKSRKCKKLSFKSNEQDNSPTILMGVVVKEDDNFLYFKTARREYTINKILILAVEDTNIPFRSGGGGSNGG